MAAWPTICVDNFYDDPDKVRDFALGLDYTPSEDGRWPGKRSKEILEIDEEFMSKFCHKLMSHYFDLQSTQLRWKISSQFQLIEPYDKDIGSIKNTGWIHYDSAVLGGLIYLNKDTNRGSGTSLYEAIDPSKYDKDQIAKHKFYREGNAEDYETLLNKHNENFVETVKFSNRYNRLIGFDSAVPHRADNFTVNNEPRLTQVFFVQDIESTRPKVSDMFSTVL